MLHLMLAISTGTSWYDGPPSYDEHTLYAIGVALMMGAVVLFAWVWQLFANSSSGYDDEQRRPLWAYIGRVALFLGAQGIVILLFSRRYSPLLLILFVVGLVITIVAIRSGNMPWGPWGRKRIDA